MKHFVAAMTICLSSPAWADVDIQAGVGYAVTGSIKTTENAKVSGTPMSFGVNYEYRGFSAGAMVQHQVLGYDEKEGSQFRGSNLLIGGLLGAQVMRFDKSFVRLEAVYYPYAVLSMASDTTSTVNGQEYSHSTLTTLTSTGANEIRVGYVVENKEGQFNKYERLRYGVFLAQLTQPMKKEKIKIVTSNPDLAPRGEVTNDVDYGLSLTSLGFLVGFAF